MVSYKEILYKTKENLFKFMKLVIIYQSYNKRIFVKINCSSYHINYHIIDLIVAKYIQKYNKYNKNIK